MLLAGWVCAALVAAPAASGSGGGAGHRTLFRFEDPAITESSGLVDAGSVVYPMNDSGSGPVLYAVDPATGETAGVTTYTDDDVVDVEALAPAPGGDVWVGDLGDNLRRRPSVALYRVEPGRDLAARRFDVAYPGGARDAETLLVHPRSGRVFVVSKTVFGGTVYEARNLAAGRTNRLRPFAQVTGLVTDGAFFPDGRHVLLRGYGAATVYTFPGFEPVGRVTLPPQKQGEGVAIGEDGRIMLSSEGLHAPVLEIGLPADLAAVVERPRAADPAEKPSRVDEPVETGGPDPVSVALGVVLVAALAGLVRAARRR
ncbi:MAG: hypothetical protein ACTHKG_17370 [Nocardioides sp.]